MDARWLRINLRGSPDNVVAGQTAGMRRNSATEKLIERMIAKEDSDLLQEAQIAAAGSVELRLLFSHVWWTGLRDGLEASGQSPMLLPKDPFRAAAVEQYQPASDEPENPSEPF